MANPLPFLFNEIARRAGEPMLRLESAVAIAGEGGDAWSARVDYDAAWNGMVDLLAPVLTRQPLAEWMSGAPGLPVLSADEVVAFLGEAERTDEAQADRWYVLAASMDGTFVLYPDEGSERALLDVLVPIATSSDTVQLRRSRLAAAPSLDRVEELEQTLVQPGTAIEQSSCVLEANRSEPDLPYRGVCSSIDCASACSPLLAVELDTSSYVLTGCACE